MDEEMTRLKTNASNLPELDIALQELQALGHGVPMYRQAGECDALFGSLDLALSRLAMFDYYNDFVGAPQPTLWCKIRGHRYDKRFDHSTHSLYPFQGKLEPRLARACINIGIGLAKTARIVDPFCGSGTVLLEANLMGLEAVGGDIDPFAIWLSETKLTTSVQLFRERFAALWDGRGDVPPTELQRQYSPPTDATVTIEERDAAALLDNESEVDAVVTSPPYYDAIDYNARHKLIRRQLELAAPHRATLGVESSIAEYEASIADICVGIAGCLRSGGRAVIVAAPYHGVDTPAIYERCLRDAGLGPIARLVRPYREQVLGVVEDVIVVMEKP